MALGDNGIPAQAYSIDNVTDGSFSTTEADKQKKYQVYLEDKLKDHLEKQSYVNEASVDITMPDKDGTILKSKEEATAAVTLGLKDSITDDQAYAIARLVATALGNDTTKGITIIDKRPMYFTRAEIPIHRQVLQHHSFLISKSWRSR